jgi:uncharacterized membrane protein YgcG
MQKRGRADRGKKKQGLSLLVIGIVFLVAFLIFVGIFLALRKGDDFSQEKFNLDAQIEKVEVDGLRNQLTISVQRKSGEGNLTGFKFVFNNGTGTEIKEEIASMVELEKRNFTIYPQMRVSSIETVTLIPFVRAGDKEVLGVNVNVYNIKEMESIIPPVQPKYLSESVNKTKPKTSGGGGGGSGGGGGGGGGGTRG